MDKVNSTNNRIFLLTGFMCAGKSFFGKKIAITLNYDFIDLDSFIEFNEKKSINEIFKLQGEKYFRSLETNYFNKIVCQAKKSLIIALGGGFPLSEENQLLMKKRTTIFIDTDFDTILSRLTNDERAKRPLLANLTHDDIKKLYEKRLTIYKNTANFVVHNFNEVLKLLDCSDNNNR